jgi:hypothetical protein
MRCSAVVEKGCGGVILKLRVVVVNGDIDDYMTYYKQRYREDIHLTRYDPASASPTSDSPHDRNTRKCHTSQKDAPRARPPSGLPGHGKKTIGSGRGTAVRRGRRIQVS